MLHRNEKIKPQRPSQVVTWVSNEDLRTLTLAAQPIAAKRTALAGTYFEQHVISVLQILMYLTFKNRASYIQDGRTATLQMLHFMYIFLTPISTEYFKHAAQSPFFSSKCRLLHNATFFRSCIIHILHTGFAKI